MMKSRARKPFGLWLRKSYVSESDVEQFVEEFKIYVEELAPAFVAASSLSGESSI